MPQCFVNQNAHVYIKEYVFFVKSNEKTYPKGRALMQMYRVVPIMKRGKLCVFQVTKKFGVPGLKASMEMVGYYGGPNRMPLQSLPKASHTTLRQIMADEGFL